MPKPYPREFREDVVAVARDRGSGVPLRKIAADFGISEICLQNWMRQADVEAGSLPVLRAVLSRRILLRFAPPTLLWVLSRRPVPVGVQ